MEEVERGGGGGGDSAGYLVEYRLDGFIGEVEEFDEVEVGAGVEVSNGEEVAGGEFGLDVGWDEWQTTQLSV